MTNLWVYEGALDSAERVLTLDTEGPSMAGDGRIAKYKDAIELRSRDERVLTSRMLGEDGTLAPGHDGDVPTEEIGQMITGALINHFDEHFGRRGVARRLGRHRLVGGDGLAAGSAGTIVRCAPSHAGI